MREEEPMPRSLLQHLVGDAAFEALFSDEAEVAAILRFEAALARSEADARLVPAVAATAIAKAVAGFTPDMADLAAGMARDGVVVPTLVRQLRAAVGEHGGLVHFGATSQDAIDTALMLRLGPAFDLIENRLAALESALEVVWQRDGHQTMMAHTRMQSAMSITVAAKLAAWGAPLVRCREALETLRPRVLVVQLGGPVGTRAELGDRADIVAARLAELLQLGTAEPWHTARDRIAELGSALSLITGALGKIGADVALLAQNEVSTIKVEGGGGSSAMAHKANPVNAELLVALARFNAGLLSTLHQALVHEHERSGSAWTLEWMVLPQMLVATGASLRIAATLMEQISFQPGKPQ
jgi:3-carboxy-cis,cis-muconate cycloisomerase